MRAGQEISPRKGIPLLDHLPVRHLFDMHVELEPAQAIATATGTRLTFIAAGGQVAGPEVNGQVLPGGGDWLRIGNDRVGRVDVKVSLRTDDGVFIHFESGGIVKVPDDGLARLGAGEAVAYDESYVRTTPRFETADERYAWLSQIVTVGYNALSPDHIEYRIYQVL